MSYASVAAHNAPSPDEQPRPDPALLTTEIPTTSSVIDSTAKLNLVAPDFKEHPHTDSEPVFVDGDEDDTSLPPRRGVASEKKKRRHVSGAREEALSVWKQVADTLVRPQVAGGLLGIINVGLIAGVGYAFYTRPSLRGNTKAVTSTVTAALALVLGEGYVAEEYSKTPEGQSAIRRAREQRHWVVQYVHDFVARTNPYKGGIGILNTAIVGGLGYAGYTNRNVPWDRRTVSAIAAGLLTLCGAEGYLLERQS